MGNIHEDIYKLRNDFNKLKKILKEALKEALKEELKKELKNKSNGNGQKRC